MGLVFGRVTNATFTIFLAFILSYAMLISLGLVAPDVLNALVQWAKTVETWITGTGLPARYNVWLDLFVEEGAILLLFFTVLARLIIAIIGSSFSSAIKSR
jgi:hypothetical protein